MANGRARQTNGGGRTRTRPPPSDSDRIIDAALAGIARQGWRRLSLADIAAEAELPILRVYRLFSSKPAILRGFFRRIDEAGLAGSPLSGAPPGPRGPGFGPFFRGVVPPTPSKTANQGRGAGISAAPPPPPSAPG